MSMGEQVRLAREAAIRTAEESQALRSRVVKYEFACFLVAETSIADKRSGGLRAGRRGVASGASSHSSLRACEHVRIRRSIFG